MSHYVSKRCGPKERPLIVYITPCQPRKVSRQAELAGLFCKIFTDKSTLFLPLASYLCHAQPSTKNWKKDIAPPNQILYTFKFTEGTRKWYVELAFLPHNRPPSSKTHSCMQAPNNGSSFQKKVWDLESSRRLTVLPLTTTIYCTTLG